MLKLYNLGKCFVPFANYCLQGKDETPQACPGIGQPPIS